MENEWRKVKTLFSSLSFWQIEEKVFTLQRKFEIRKMKKSFWIAWGGVFSTSHG